MSATETFNNPDFPIETRLRAAIHCLEHVQSINTALMKRKTPPERAEMDELRRKLELAEQRIASERQNAEVWKKVAGEMSARIDAIKDGTLIPRLERERDDWKRRWQAVVVRIGVLIEHQGNVELLEEQRNCLERQNAALRAGAGAAPRDPNKGEV